MPEAGPVMTHDVGRDSRALGIGMVGGGFMAAVHTRAARAAGARLVAVTGSSEQRARETAHELGYDSAAPHFEAMLTDPSIDVIHICTPNATHARFATAAFEAGKHVVCEKPIAVSGDEAERVRLAGQRAGRMGAVPFVYRFHPMVREARSVVARGQLGAVLTVQGSYLQDWLMDAGDQNWRTDVSLGGSSRAFADIGSHLCDLLEFVTGDRIARLAARTRTVFAERRGDPVANEDIASLLVEFERGALGTLLVSQLAPGRKNALTFELHGSAESVRFEQERPEELWLGRRRGSRLVLRDGDADAPDSARLSIIPSGHALGYQDAFNAFVADAYAAIRGEAREGLPVLADGARAAQLTDAVLVSEARGGAWIEVSRAS